MSKSKSGGILGGNLRSHKESLLYQKGYHDGFIEGRNEGVKLARKTVAGAVNSSLVIPKDSEIIDFESNPDGKPMRITPIEEDEK